MGTLYNYFADCAAILAYVTADYLDEVTGRCWTMSRGSITSPSGSFRRGETGLVPKDRGELLEDTLGSTVYGMLLLYITGRGPAPAEVLLERMDEVVRLMFV